MYTEDIQREIEQLSIKVVIVTSSIKIFGQYISDHSYYNQTSKKFNIKKMMIIANPESTNYIFIECPSIKKNVLSNPQPRDIIEGNK